jgi:septum formation protein
MTEDLVLASASTVRAQLLAAAGVDFRIKPAELDEGLLKQACRAEERDAAGCALVLAEAKARQVSVHCGQAVVIGADQLLVCDEAWFDKPADLGQARTQLRALHGRTHELVTAVCAVRGGSRLWYAVSSPRLAMRHFTDDWTTIFPPREPTLSARSALTDSRAKGYSYLIISREIISRSWGCHFWSFSVF